MSQLANIDKDYLKWFSEIKSKIRSTQIRAALAANATLIEFYYDLGRMIVEKQAQSVLGDKLVQQLSKDLQAEFPEMRGLSYTNLKYCRQFFLYFQLPSKSIIEISQQSVDQIGPQLGDKMQLIKNKQIIISPQLGGQLDIESGRKLRNFILNTPWGHLKEELEESIKYKENN